LEAALIDSVSDSVDFLSDLFPTLDVEDDDLDLFYLSTLTFLMPPNYSAEVTPLLN
jgi:hypothetical protein